MGHRYWFVIGWVILLFVTILPNPSPTEMPGYSRAAVGV